MLMVLQWIRDPEWWMRLTVRFSVLLNSGREREQIARKNDLVAYYYFGTTGDERRDARIRRMRIYGRSLGILAVSAFLLACLVALTLAISS
jgi:hypothetical protein